MKIRGYENYTIFTDGSILGPRGNILKTDPNSTGYYRVTLSKEGVTKRRFVHQLVAEHFLDKLDETFVVNHIDGDNQNNKASNLEWVSASYNVRDGYRRGRRNPNKYSELKIHQMRTYFKLGWLIKDIAALYKADRDTVARYVRQ